jgi:hypothetical protein
MIDTYRKRQPSEMTLDEILGAGIAEAHQRALRAEEENARLRAEIAELREADSEPPEPTSVNIRTSNLRVSGPAWPVAIAAVALALALAAWTVREYLVH